MIKRNNETKMCGFFGRKSKIVVPVARQKSERQRGRGRKKQRQKDDREKRERIGIASIRSGRRYTTKEPTNITG